MSLLGWTLGAALSTVGLAALAVTALARLGLVAAPGLGLLSGLSAPGYVLAGVVFAAIGGILAVSSRPRPRR